MPLHPSEEQESEVHELAEGSARLWNKVYYQRRQAIFKDRMTLSYPFQCNYLKSDPDFELLGNVQVSGSSSEMGWMQVGGWKPCEHHRDEGQKRSKNQNSPR
jgi:hypothetical protein